MADDQNPQLPLTPPPGDGGPGAANIQPVNIEEEMRRSYLDYSLSVIIGRALPDVRDGLKPVHRRILYTMQQMGLQPNRATRKCARIVGDTMGKYHPHGNLAVYDALVRMAQPFAMRYPLVDGQGNFGSVDGDPPAADRYTEARLTRVASALLEDLEKDTVDFRENYDGSEVEPDVLPSRVPNLLINGSDGIAVGMATKIPPHNLTEVVDAAITLVNNPATTLPEILKIVKGPDFPTAGIIHGKSGILDAYKNGRGRFTMRARAALEKFSKDREHILEGYLTALDHLDNVIAIIRGSANRADARENLVMYFGGKKIEINTTGRAPKLPAEKPFTSIQADAILELQLHRLTRLSIDEINKELGTTRENITEFESILGSEKKLRKVIVTELEEIKKLYGDERRTVIEDEAAEIHLEDLIADEQVAVTVSHSGYMKRTPISTYRQQRRGGQGRTGMKTRDEDFVEHLFIASTHAYILIFTNTGRVYWLKVYEIPDVGAAGKGKHVGNLVSLQPGETVRTMLAVRNLEEEGRYIFFATRNGTVKKSEVREFMHVRSNGIMAIGIDQADELVAARITDGNQIVFLATHEGMAIRFDESHVRPMGRGAFGVRGVDLAEKDYVVGMATTTKPEAAKAGGAADASSPKDTSVPGKEEAEPEVIDVAIKGDLILSVTENGFGKRTAADEYRLTNRGGKGVINVKTTERVGKVVAIAQVDETAEVMLISHYGKIIRMDSTTIRESGRNAQGVRLLNMEPGDRVAAAVVLAPDAEPNGGNGGGTLIQ